LTSATRPLPLNPTLLVVRRWLRPWLIATVVCVLYLISTYIHYGNVMEFVRPGSAYAGDLSRYTRDYYGYDGQYNYYIAVAPLEAPAHMDVPSYRYQRMAYPLLARALAVGQPGLVLFTLIGINLFMLAIGTWLLEQLLIAQGVSRWYALSYGLFGGILVAVRASMSETMAYGLAIAAIWVIQRNGRYALGWAAVLLGVAALTKETTLFFAGGYVLYYLVQRRWSAAVLISVGALLPFALWQIALRIWLGNWGVGSGGGGATPFEIIPFGGIWQSAAYGAYTFLIEGALTIPFALIPTVWALWRSLREIIGRADWRSAHPYAYLLLANAAFMPFLPFSTYREPLGVARLLIGLVISTLLFAAMRKDRRVLRYTFLWLLFGLIVLG